MNMFSMRNCHFFRFSDQGHELRAKHIPNEFLVMWCNESKSHKINHIAFQSASQRKLNSLIPYWIWIWIREIHLVGSTWLSIRKAVSRFLGRWVRGLWNLKWVAVGFFFFNFKGSLEDQRNKTRGNLHLQCVWIEPTMLASMVLTALKY